jgi:hypothetical protein
MANMGKLGNSMLANVVQLADSRLASIPNIGRDACSVLANVDGLANSRLANCDWQRLEHAGQCGLAC